MFHIDVILYLTLKSRRVFFWQLGRTNHYTRVLESIVYLYHSQKKEFFFSYRNTKCPLEWTFGLNSLTFFNVLKLCERGFCFLYIGIFPYTHIRIYIWVNPWRPNNFWEIFIFEQKHYRSVFSTDFFSASDGWAMKNRCGIVFGSKTYWNRWDLRYSFGTPTFFV